MARKYNFIYKELVNDKDDIVGHIAYSLYKSDKIKYIEKFKAENGVEDLTEDDLKHFHDVSTIDTSISRYRNTAIDLLQDFSNNIISEQVEQIESDYENHLRRIVKPLKTQWWEAIVQSVIGAFVFAILLAAVAFIIQYKGLEIRIELPTQTTETQITAK